LVLDTDLYGKKQGKYDWQSCTSLADKDGNFGTCDGPSFSCNPDNSHVYVRNQTDGLLYQSNLVQVTNQTACVDGYIHGWNHVCDQKKARDSHQDCPLTMPREVSTPILGSTEHVSNMTACLHGYARAWNHDCSPKKVKTEEIGIPFTLE
jgi:hypothetical protein